MNFEYRYGLISKKMFAEKLIVMDNHIECIAIQINKYISNNDESVENSLNELYVFKIFDFDGDFITLGKLKKNHNCEIVNLYDYHDKIDYCRYLYSHMTPTLMRFYISNIINKTLENPSKLWAQIYNNLMIYRKHIIRQSLSAQLAKKSLYEIKRIALDADVEYYWFSMKSCIIDKIIDSIKDLRYV